MDAQAIFDNFHTHAQGTEGLATVVQTAQQLAAKYQDRALTTQGMIDTIHAGWKGAGAEAASQGLAPLAENALNSHQQLGTGQDIVSRQVDSFHTAASQVQPVPPAPSMTDIIGAFSAGGNPHTILDQLEKRHAAQQANVDAYSQYVDASQYNTTNVPTLTPLSTSGAPVSVVPPSAPQGPAPQGGGSTSHVAEHQGPETSTRSTLAAPPGMAQGSTGQAVGSPGGTGSGGASNGPSDSGVTGTSGAGPVAPPTLVSRPIPVGPPTGSGPVSGGPVQGNPIIPVGGLPTADDGSVRRSGGLRNVPPSRGVPGAGGPRSGSGPFPGEGEGPGGGSGPRGGGLGTPGEPTTGGPRSRAGGPVTGQPGSGARTGGGLPVDEENPRAGARNGGAGPGVAAEEEAMAAKRGITGRGASSATSPMLGGRGAQDGEDAEHKRRYGLDEDGEERFGTDERTVPPVIGETAIELERRLAQEAGHHRREH